MSVRKLQRLKLELMAGVNPNKGRGKRVRVRIIPSNKPGSLRIDNAKIDDLIGFP
jgi:hypothetical protein